MLTLSRPQRGAAVHVGSGKSVPVLFESKQVWSWPNQKCKIGVKCFCEHISYLTPLCLSLFPLFCICQAMSLHVCVYACVEV